MKVICNKAYKPGMPCNITCEHSIQHEKAECYCDPGSCNDGKKKHPVKCVKFTAFKKDVI